MISSFRALITSLLLLTLAACGGGGSLERDNSGGGGGGTPTEPTLSVSLSLADSSGAESNVLSANNPLVVTATITDENGDAVANEDVSFSISEADLAVFAGSVSIVRTDGSGQASVTIEVGSLAGGAFVVASVGTNTTAQIGFNSQGPEQTVVEPASLEFFTSSIQLASSGSDSIELVAVVKNEQNVLLEGVAVSFSVNSGNLQITQGTTTADGTARATLNTTNNPQNRVITATARTGDFIETLDIDVVGTEVNISGPSSVIINDPVPLTIIVADSDGVGIPNQAVSLTTTGGTLDNVAPSTGPTGQVQVVYTASGSGTDVVTASSLNAEGSISLIVQEDEFSFTTLPTEEVPLGEDATLSVTWLKESLPFENGAVVFTASRGDIASATVTTNSDGVASISISSDNAGLASISAEGTDADGNTVTTRAQIEFIATVPNTIITDATPDSLGPDGQTSTITAVVRDSTGNLVKGQTVNFRVEDTSGGFLSSPTAVTDGSGIASVVYTSNAVSSQDFVRVYAEVSDNTSIVDFTTLTVGDRAFDITLGTGREIQSPDEASYLKEFAVFVSDADSNPVANTSLTVASTPVKFNLGGTYRKGSWIWDPVAEIWEPIASITCANEDINGNGILDEGEDTNNDGLLTPGNIAVATNEVITDDNGQATVEVRYPKQFGAWADIALRVSGQSNGSESVETQNFTLTVAAADVTEESSPPPRNPFGALPTCTNNR